MTVQNRRKVARWANCQDVLDASPHKVAEVIAGTLRILPRSAMRNTWAGSIFGATLSIRLLACMRSMQIEHAPRLRRERSGGSPFQLHTGRHETIPLALDDENYRNS